MEQEWGLEDLVVLLLKELVELAAEEKAKIVTPLYPHLTMATQILTS